MSEKKKYEKFYARITAKIRRIRYGRRMVNIADKILTRIIFVIYPLLLLWVFSGFIRNEGTLTDGIKATLPFVLVPGVSFVILSIVRNLLSRKRPYEEYDIDPLIHKEKKGRSMPSRHVFSSAVISMCALAINVPLGIFCMAVTVGAAFVRVIGGVHYPGDVAVGFIVGVLSGCVLFII